LDFDPELVRTALCEHSVFMNQPWHKFESNSVSSFSLLACCYCYQCYVPLFWSILLHFQRICYFSIA